MESKQIALTILNQLGGMKFKVMVGAYNMVYDQNGALSIRFKGSKKANCLKVDYDKGMDSYNMEFGKIRGLNYKITSEHKGVYCDMLADIFESETDLYTSF